MRALLLSLAEFVRTLAALTGAITALLLLLFYGSPGGTGGQCSKTCRAESCCPVCSANPFNTEHLSYTIDSCVSGTLAVEHKVFAAGDDRKRVYGKPVKPKLLCPEGAASSQGEVRR